jgi:hypothetical protein
LGDQGVLPKPTIDRWHVAPRPDKEFDPMPNRNRTMMDQDV